MLKRQLNNTTFATFSPSAADSDTEFQLLNILRVTRYSPTQSCATLHPLSNAHADLLISPRFPKLWFVFFNFSSQMAGSLLWPLLGIVLVVFLAFRKTNTGVGHIPIVRYSSYLPDFFNRLIFYPKASSMIYWGYLKVCT